jgi:hypothetical protein
MGRPGASALAQRRDRRDCLPAQRHARRRDAASGGVGRREPVRPDVPPERVAADRNPARRISHRSACLRAARRDALGSTVLALPPGAPRRRGARCVERSSPPSVRVRAADGRDRDHHGAGHQPETDSHYGCVFSIWDRLFGTWRGRMWRAFSLDWTVFENRESRPSWVC